MALIALLASHLQMRSQSLADYTEYYRLLRINADERLAFCYPTATPVSEPMAIGVKRDTLGRPVQITRFRFGNADSRSAWATLQIEYKLYETINTLVERRTFASASGMPVLIGWAFAEEVYRRMNGELLQRKIVDRAGKPVNDEAGVHRAFYKIQEPGTIVQEWYYANGKLHFGTGSDGSMRPFAPMPPQTYYRRYMVDTAGNLLREQLTNFNRKPIPFPGGEFVRSYEVNECGLPTKVTFLDLEGEPMEDSSGVAMITFTYDDAGRMTEWRAFDSDESPKGRRGDGVAAVVYTYRAFDGVLMKEELFDAKGKVIAQ